MSRVVHIGSYGPVDCGLLIQSYVSLASVGLTLGLALEILAVYEQLGRQ